MQRRMQAFLHTGRANKGRGARTRTPGYRLIFDNLALACWTSSKPMGAKPTMRKLLTALAPIVALTVLAGCQTSGEPVAAPTIVPPTTTKLTDDKVFAQAKTDVTAAL